MIERRCTGCGAPLLPTEGPTCGAPRALLGGHFTDETGWWQVEEIRADGTVWLLGKNGKEREMPLANVPELEYL